MENSLRKSYDGVFSQITVMCNLCFLNSFKENYNIRQSMVTIVDIPSYLLVTCYSVWFFRNDFLIVAVCIIPAVYGIQGLIKVYVQIINRNTLLSINELIINFYKYINEKYPKFNNELNKKLNICILLINIMFKLFLASGFIVGIYPFIILLYKQQSIKYLQLPFGFILPVISHETFPGLGINYAYNLLQVYLVTTGITSLDALCLLYVYNGCLQIEAIILMLQDLDNLLQSYESNKQEIEIIINDIIETHQIQRRYMQLIDETYKMNYMVVIASDMMQIVLVLILLSTTTWYLGLVFFMVGTIQIFFVCFLGTYMVIIHEKLEQAVYNIKWYNLELKKQKHILMVLMIAQRPTNLSIGGMMDLDLNAFVQVYKTIYSFFMMMQNMEQT